MMTMGAMDPVVTMSESYAESESEAMVRPMVIGRTMMVITGVVPSSMLSCPVNTDLATLRALLRCINHGLDDFVFHTHILQKEDVV